MVSLFYSSFSSYNVSETTVIEGKSLIFFCFQLFLKLCEHRNQSNGYVKSGDSLGMENHEEDTEVFQERGILSMRSVFEEVTQSLLDLQEHMISDLVKHVVQGFRMLSKPYKKEK